MLANISLFFISASRFYAVIWRRRSDVRIKWFNPKFVFTFNVIIWRWRSYLCPNMASSSDVHLYWGHTPRLSPSMPSQFRFQSHMVQPKVRVPISGLVLRLHSCLGRNMASPSAQRAKYGVSLRRLPLRRSYYSAIITHDLY